ncbi:unnamed protein product [Rotaria magnacalcarata]|nr:unnamed protein product [Rotaria magnacalcarata]CAF3912934.1 unnamed protein product [Rotaria magnacalcarata]CAF3914799.1 unnamed protein product [Rotaria magnacalcarata]CAF4098925.1 unnamed protein product [Rotaria magnacalcarata]
MSNIIRGYQLSQVVCAMAQLGIADLLTDQPRSSIDLAQATNTDANSLKRLLHTLASFDVVIEDESGMFSLTSLGSTLRSDVFNSLHDMAIAWCHPVMYGAWTNMLESIRTGYPTFNNIFGTDFYSYLHNNTEFNGIFNRAMGSMDRHAELITIYDFSGAKCVLDVGGGKGVLMMYILRRYWHLIGILYDLSHVTEDARKLFAAEESDISQRLSIISGDLFVSVPTGADTVILSHMLMNFDDSKTKLLLSNCRAAMTSGDKLLIIEVVLRDNTNQLDGRLNDLNMLVLLGGRYRNEQEYVTLLEQTGFILKSNIQMKCNDNLLTCHAV